jgi:hypothetical protein
MSRDKSSLVTSNTGNIYDKLEHSNLNRKGDCVQLSVYDHAFINAQSAATSSRHRLLNIDEECGGESEICSFCSSKRQLVRHSSLKGKH